MIPAQTKIYTEDDLMRLDAQEQRYELVNGELVAMSPNGLIHVWVAATIYRAIYDHVTPRKLGYAFNDNLLYVLYIDPITQKRSVRVPDASFLRWGRLNKATDLSRPFYGAPDLAVEVMSPGDSAVELLARVRDYFRYGTEQVWVLYPEQKELHQHSQGQAAVITYTRQDHINTSAFFPELTLITEDLFALPEMDDG